MKTYGTLTEAQRIRRPLELRIADLEAKNALFRGLVDAWTFSDTPPTESDIKRMADAYAKIIEGGALK